MGRRRASRSTEFKIVASLLGGSLMLVRSLLHQNPARRQMLLEFRWQENMSSLEFERCCADYLNLNGWRAATTKGSGDQGVDVIAKKAGRTIVMQCKLHSSPVGNKAVQEVFAGLAYQRAERAVVVSNQRYTPSAMALAAKTGVLLIHFTDLRDLDRQLGFHAPR